MLNESNIWSDKRVFLTGHTGFKGSWLALWLSHLGAQVRGYSLDPASRPNLFELASVGMAIEDVRGDIRDADSLDSAIMEFAPDVIFHLAAQPLVRASYADPITTYETNIIGTARVLEAVRRTPSARAVVCVTTDKCYDNKEWVWGYRETDALGGYDPYSSSKACAEIVSAAFRSSYFPPAKFSEHRVGLATARAGNVIGGGDWSFDRLIPDLIRGFLEGTPVPIRYPHAIRPWQHVVEPLYGYLKLAEGLLEDSSKLAPAYNFGPGEGSARSVGWIADRLVRSWGSGAAWFTNEDHHLHEATWLKLDSSRARIDLRWSAKLDLKTTLEWVVRWYQAYSRGQDMRAVTLDQIREYQALVDSTTDKDEA